MATTLWYRQNGELERFGLAELVWIDRQGEISRAPGRGKVAISPNCQHQHAIASLLLPARFAVQVTRNGSPLSAGLTALFHTDCVEIDEHPFWISSQHEPEETDYTPGRQSADAFCFLTKARLREGEPITLCPGQPGQPCGVIYRRAAWQAMVSQASRFRCPNCSFDPKSPPWMPPTSAPRRALDDILRLLKPENQR